MLKVTIRFPIRILPFVVLAAAVLVFWFQSSDMEAIKAANAGVTLPGRRAVVVGGTSGIGHGIAIRLAKSQVAVTIVGRDATRGNAIVAELASYSPAAHEFVRCDVSLLGNVATCAAALALKYPVLDILVLTQGIGSLQGYTPTAEGIDVKLALHYYSRAAFALWLSPSIARAPEPRVLSVLMAGTHPPLDPEILAKDPGLREHYSLKTCAEASCFYNDLGLDALSRLPGNDRVKFIHAAPGYVNTAWGTDMPWPVRMLLRAIQPFFRSIEDCGEAMCVPIFTPGTGLTLVDKDGSPTASVTSGHTPAARDTLWAHTLDVLRPFTPAVVPGEAAAASEAEVK